MRTLGFLCHGRLELLEDLHELVSEPESILRFLGEVDVAMVCVQGVHSQPILVQVIFIFTLLSEVSKFRMFFPLAFPISFSPLFI